VIVVMTSEKKKALTPIESLFQEYVVPFSYPVNWKLFDQFKLKKYPAKESYEATVYFGYLASWQSFYTKKRKLQKGGYFFRSVDDVTDDIYLSQRAQLRAKKILEDQGLITTKTRPGQASLVKVNVNKSAKYLNRAQIEYATKHKRGDKPGSKRDTNNGLELNGNSNKEGKGVETEKQVSTITFNDYKNTNLKPYKTYTRNDDDDEKYDMGELINCIEYFLLKHEQTFNNRPGKWTKVLQLDTWEVVFYKMMFVSDTEGRLYDVNGKRAEMSAELKLSADDVRTMIDYYFSKEYQKGCDYSIVHFNNHEIKRTLYYELFD